jgi:hypothetical protein
MSTNDLEPQSKSAPRAGFVLLLALLGVAVICIARYAGRPLSPGELIYDLGVAIFTVALIDLFLLRLVAAISSRQTEMEKIAQELRILDANAEKRLVEWDKRFKQLKVDVLQNSVDRISGNVDAANTKLDAIFRKIP